MAKLKKSLPIALSLLLPLNGCVVGYRNYPRQQLSSPAPEKKLETFYYNIEGTSLAGGYLAIRKTFKRESPFRDAQERSEVSPTGIHIKVKVETISMSVGAIVAGYISYSTLTLIPAWSTKDGAMVQFFVYKNGAIVKSFDYETRRFIGVWLGFLPLIWVNIFTANEEEVFTAITKQFFEDAAPVFS